MGGEYHVGRLRHNRYFQGFRRWFQGRRERGSMSRLKRWIGESRQWAVDRFATLLRPERILVVHIPKTAGTSLRRMLQNEYGPRLVYPGDPHLERLPNGWYPSGRELLRDFRSLPPHNVLVGHVPACLGDLLPSPYQAVTFLRDPIQRSLSLLNHWSRMTGKPIAEFMDDEQFMTTRVADFQTRILGADGVPDHSELESIDAQTLARALQRLDTMAFIGLTEQFEESCQRFDECFGTRIGRFMRHDNVQRPGGRELAELIPRIEPLLKRDRVLYETAVSRFQALRG